MFDLEHFATMRGFYFLVNETHKRQTHQVAFSYRTNTCSDCRCIFLSDILSLKQDIFT